MTENRHGPATGVFLREVSVLQRYPLRLTELTVSPIVAILSDHPS